MLLQHPGLAKFSCAGCQTWVYDLETGERKTYRSGPNREIRYYQQNLAPCFAGQECGKGSPIEEFTHVLNARNRQCYLAYQRARAVNFQGVELDELAMDNFAIIDQVVREYEQITSARRVGAETARVMVVAMGGRA